MGFVPSKTMSLIHFDNKNIATNIRSQFAAKVVDISQYLGVNPDWLMQLMYAESKLNYLAKNTQGGRLVAAGLIQWTVASGVDPNFILTLSPLEQLDRVKAYFTPYRNKMKSYFDMYLVTFFPAAVGKSDTYVFETSKLKASTIAQQNPAVNSITKDAKITMAEFKKYVLDSTPVAVRSAVFGVFETIKSGGGIVVTVAIAALFYSAYKLIV